MYPSLFVLLSSFLLIIGCSTPPMETSFYSVQLIKGRDLGIVSFKRSEIYRAKVPLNWERIDPQDADSLFDTKKSLCEFVIREATGDVKITIHNFPSEQLSERIPPNAQLMRWKSQFSSLELRYLSIVPQSFSGFSGFLFSGAGILQGELTMMLAWIMQIAPEHYLTLSLSNIEKLTVDEMRQMRADFTIKAVGPKKLVEKNKEAIVAFAHSFELIQEIPVRR